MPLRPDKPAAPAASPGRWPARFLLSRFRRDRGGATAVEFGLVALPFFALLFAIIEIALVFWSTQVLETALADASRRIYTGQFQGEHGAKSNDDLRDQFKKDVCDRVVGLFNCNAMVHIDVQPYNSFTGASVPVPIKDGAIDVESLGYRASGPQEIVVVRAVMEYPVFVTLLNKNQANLANGKRLIMASTAFRNEPFGQ